MRNGRNALHAALVGFVVAGMSIPISSFAQGARRVMGPPPAAPKVTTTPTDAWHPKSSAYIKASNTKGDAQFGFAVALSGDGNTLAVGAVEKTVPLKALTAFQEATLNMLARCMSTRAARPAGNN